MFIFINLGLWGFHTSLWSVYLCILHWFELTHVDDQPWPIFHELLFHHTIVYRNVPALVTVELLHKLHLPIQTGYSNMAAILSSLKYWISHFSNDMMLYICVCLCSLKPWDPLNEHQLSRLRQGAIPLLWYSSYYMSRQIIHKPSFCWRGKISDSCWIFEPRRLS